MDQVLLSQLEGEEIDTSLSAMSKAYSRVTGADLPDARATIRELMTEVVRAQRGAPRSKPEHTPSLEAQDGDYTGEGERITRGIPPGTRTEKIPSGTETEKHAPEKRRADEDYLVLSGNEALEAIKRLAGVSEMDARRLLAEGDGEDLPAPRPYSRKRNEVTYDSRELEKWAAQYQGARKRRKGTEDQSGRRPWQRGMQASDRDINSPGAGSICFGDTRDGQFRQNSHLLASDFFRTDS